MRKFIIVYKPMFKKQYHIERHHFNDGILYKKDILCGHEYMTKQDANIALDKLVSEVKNNA